MPPNKSSLAGSFPLFKVGGIQVYLHWSWFLVAYIELQFRTSSYSFQAWNIAEYLTLFGIVLVHEFGHALACRQVGGQANEIVLWPLGGIAYVNPPPRPGALLWSIAAGPLVNVLLVPLTIGAFFFGRVQGWAETNPDADYFVTSVLAMNLGLLIFNLLPIYPLDGGQILQVLLWFLIGRARSLMVVSVIGLVGAAGIIGLAVLIRDLWIGVLAAFAALNCLAGFRQARFLALMARAVPHEDASCPSCRAHPVRGDFWACDQCHTRFDTFTHLGVCPRCAKAFPGTICPHCRQAHPIAHWFAKVKTLSAADGQAPEPA